ncbi:Nonribosomal peptide synthetase sirP [Metarhizium anisopliae]|nr:Nonribosomal peptide synthetase sirP [Metarhizium anisopliae]
MFSSLVAMQVNLQNRFGNSRHRTYDWDWTLKARSEFPLTLDVEEQGEECIRIRIVYDHQRLRKNYVKTLVNHYKNIVDQVLQSDKSAVGRVLGRMMDPDEYCRLTRPHDQFYTYFEGADNLVTAICNAVRQWPDLVAVQSGREPLTYMELDDVSSRAGCGLKEILADGENVVSVMSDGLIEWTICILAVLKAGAAYCPIDVKLPAERMSTMISESNSLPYSAQTSHHGRPINKDLQDRSYCSRI